MSTPSPPKRQMIPISALPSFLGTCFCLLLFLLLFSLSMRYGLNHDEHQFIASAALLANDGLLPYVDYPYFHMPYLVFVYAGLFQLSPYLLWSARFFSVICGWLTLVLTFGIGWRLFRAYKPALRFGMAAGGALLLLANPLFTHTSGRSWNHDLPVLLTMLAFLCLRRTVGAGLAPAPWLLLSGLLIGLATGVRLSFAVVAVPFAIVICLLPALVDYRHASRGRALLFFGGGIFLGLLPALLLFGMAPEQFWFGNLGYAELNTRYFAEIRGQEKAMTIGGKFVYLAMLMVQEPSNLLLLLLFLGVLLQKGERLRSVLRGGRLKSLLRGERLQSLLRGGRLKSLLRGERLRSLLRGERLRSLLRGERLQSLLRGERLKSLLRGPRNLDLSLLLLMQPFLLVGAFAASPSQEQYFFVMVPFLVLALLYLLAESNSTQRALYNDFRRKERSDLSRSPWLLRFFALITVITCLLAIPEYITVWRVFFPSEWQPMKVERDAKQLATLTQGGKVLTVAPVLPLEGGLAIYPALATGSFALRVAPLIPQEVRQKQALFSEEELLEFIAAEPPRAILVGLNNDDKPAEGVLVAYASEHDYVQWKLPDDSFVWFSPLVEWGEKIRLGTYTRPLLGVGDSRFAPSPPLPLAHSQKRVITFYLQAIAPIERDLNVLVRLVGRDGSEVWRDEGWPFGSATSTWEVGEVWPDGHEILLPSDLASDYYRLELSFYDPETFEMLPAKNSQSGDSLGDVVALDYLALGDLPTFSVRVSFALPAIPLNPPAEIGSAIRLLGHEILDNVEKGDRKGTPLQVRLFWQTKAELSTNYTIFAHLVAPDGELITQQDQQPLGGFFPTSAWGVSQVIPDEYELLLPADAPTGPYELRIGLYDSATGARLPIMRDGQVIGDYVPIMIE